MKRRGWSTSRSARRWRRLRSSAKRRASKAATRNSGTWAAWVSTSWISPSHRHHPRAPGVNRVRKLRWVHQPCDDDDAKRLADAAKLPLIIARLMCLRGLGDPEEAARFLAPSLDHLHDPW